MNILDSVKELASTATNKADEIGQVVASATQTAVTSTVHAVEKVTGMDLNGDGSIGEHSDDLPDAAQTAQLPKDDETL